MSTARPGGGSPDVVVLNGTSSAGTSTLARALQERLPRPYLVLGVDTLVDALPPALTSQDDGLLFGTDGSVSTGAAFRVVEDAWYAGVAAIATAGVGVVLDEVLLGGGASQRRLAAALRGLHVRWVGVHCDVDVTTAREVARGDRTAGMAAAQAGLVHEGVAYDVLVDTSTTPPAACAEQVLEALRRLDGPHLPAGTTR